MTKTLARDIGASVVVFLVALPLCLGIAIACGAPPALGIISGIIGGIVVGVFGGSPLQVSGPAAGLVVLVWAIIQDWGLEVLGLAVLTGGVLQLAAAALKLGRWFRAVSPALIAGMLAGIGALIIASQLHVMVGATPPSGGVAAAIALPGAWTAEFSTAGGLWSAGIGVGTILLLAAWARFRPERLSNLPGPLLAVVVATGVVAVFGLPVARVELPSSLLSSLNIPSAASLHVFSDLGFLGAALALGIIGAAETLLCASATDQLHDGPRTNYERELFGVGLANVLAGLVGALPITGVIVRSAANIEAGAKTRRSAIIHGVLLLVVVALMPWLLRYIPIAALAGVLVFVGAKLLAPQKARALHAVGGGELAVFLVTVCSIFVAGLLTGIAVGLAISLLKLLYTFSHLEVEVSHKRGQDRWDIDAHGAATFVQLPKLAEALEGIPEEAEVHVHLGGLAYVDHACAELLHKHEARRRRAGGELITEWNEVHRLRDRRPLVERATSAARLRKATSAARLRKRTA